MPPGAVPTRGSRPVAALPCPHAPLRHAGVLVPRSPFAGGGSLVGGLVLCDAPQADPRYPLVRLKSVGAFCLVRSRRASRVGWRRISSGVRLEDETSATCWAGATRCGGRSPE